MYKPSAQIESLIAAVAVRDDASGGLQAAMDRVSDFATPLEAQLTGIAVDPAGRQVAEKFLDDYWSNETRQERLLADGGTDGGTDRELIIGGGFHAAVYAAVRVLSGHPRPLVLERGARVGGTFAMTSLPTFSLNSRNRAGRGGPAGDQGTSLNYLPGAPVQVANLSMQEYQTNADMALVIRLTLAQFADVVTNARVTTVFDDDGRNAVELADRAVLLVDRIIDARGLGDPIDADLADGTTILTFAQFMSRMQGSWPLRGVRRVAVIGGGDAGRCAVESLLGIAPPPRVAAVALDSVDRIDWYAPTLPTTCEAWVRESRGRYQAIGRYLRPDRFGVLRLNVVTRRARPVALPGAAIVDGRTYDLAVVCTGNRETTIEGLEYSDFGQFAGPSGDAVARKYYAAPIFRIGPHAYLPFTDREQADGIADIPQNAVSMFRTAGKTATLAATLPGVADDLD